jgi:hypothetical protein
VRGTIAGTVAAIAVLGLLLTAPVASAEFGFLPGADGASVVAKEEPVAAVPAGGGPPETVEPIARRVGGHPFTLTTDVNFNRDSGGEYTDGDVKNLSIDLPPGLIENAAIVNRCSTPRFISPRPPVFQQAESGESCPDGSQIGLVTVRGSFPGGERSFGVFNLVPRQGFSSTLGFNPFGSPITFSSRIRDSAANFGLTLESHNIPQRLNISGFKMVLWGNPWLVQHDLQRGACLNELDPSKGFGTPGKIDPNPEPRIEPSFYQAGTCSIGNPLLFPPFAYLTLPTACTGPMPLIFTATSWQSPVPVSRSTAMDALEGCDARALATTATARLSSDRSSSSTGLDITLDLPQKAFTNNFTPNGALVPASSAPGQVKWARIALPEGITVNPSAGSGLGVCAPAQFAADVASAPPGSGCPNDSKLGELTVNTPLFDHGLPGGEGPSLTEVVEGGLFLAKPYDNPFGTLLAVYLVARVPDRGVIVRVAGRVDVDPGSGRLVATFDDLPQLPYSRFNLHFREGQRSLLATPATCGTYATGVDLSSWLDPSFTRSSQSQFQIGSGVGGGPCPTGIPPFAPAATSGTKNSNAGAYSPYYLHLTRTDDEQEITSYSAELPRGLLGAIKGVSFCPEAAIEAAARNGGFAEADQPSCPAASRIGHTTAGYGLGGTLAYAPGNLYLAGPFHGSQLSVVAIDSATVGPFDLGVIIVRSAIKVDPQTAQVSIDSVGSDRIPHIIDGIPLHLRDIRVYIDRPNFMINPTSCDQLDTAATLTGSAADFSRPGDDVTALARSPFHASNCSSLGFFPRMSLRLKGGTARGKYPSLRATVTRLAGEANIAKATVTLPPSLFLEQGHIDTVCTRPQSAAGKCPVGSIYGWASATTPLLDDPMVGPVYLRASNNKLPDLVAALSGRGARIDVVGRIDSVKGRMRASYEVLPDAPVSKFVLTLNGGKHGLLVNSDDLCKVRPATARMQGHNGEVVTLRPSALNPKCRKKSAGKRHGKDKMGGRK